MTVSDLPSLSQGYALHDKAPDAAKTLKAARDFEYLYFFNANIIATNSKS